MLSYQAQPGQSLLMCLPYLLDSVCREALGHNLLLSVAGTGDALRDVTQSNSSQATSREQGIKRAQSFKRP